MLPTPVARRAAPRCLPGRRTSHLYVGHVLYRRYIRPGQADAGLAAASKSKVCDRERPVLRGFQCYLPKTANLPDFVDGYILGLPARIPQIYNFVILTKQGSEDAAGIAACRPTVREEPSRECLAILSQRRPRIKDCSVTARCIWITTPAGARRSGRAQSG